MKTKEKTFDAVEMMRDIRNDLYEATEGMTFEEFKAFIQTKKSVATPVQRRVTPTRIPTSRRKKEFA
jgi:hypothetical protein